MRRTGNGHGAARQNGSTLAAPPCATPVECIEAARDAGLRYVQDTGPGIRRRRTGAGFSYQDASGARITDSGHLDRIRALAIPPAWTGVWICPDPRGHLQATGRDARGRKQYRYHSGFRAVRDARKYDRMARFGRALPAIRRRTDQDLSGSGLTRHKVLAAVVQLLKRTLIRIGNEEYARANGSYGLTTLRCRHVRIAGATLHFDFKGKGGRQHVLEVNDRRLARVVSRCQELPGQELFQYADEHGERHTIGSGDVNDYLQAITGEDFTAKDFRTWSATVLAARALRQLHHWSSTRHATRHLNLAVDAVAERLGHTRAICRRSYVHPVVIDAYESGALGNGQGARRRARGGRDPGICTIYEIGSCGRELPVRRHRADLYQAGSRSGGAGTFMPLSL
jgi:DNA topoisomerase I